MIYKVLSQIKRGETLYKIGETIELSEEEGKILVKDKVLAEIEKPKQPEILTAKAEIPQKRGRKPKRK